MKDLNWHFPQLNISTVQCMPSPILIRNITPYEELLIKFLKKINMVCEFALDFMCLITE